MKVRWVVLGLVVLTLLAPALTVTATRLFEPAGGRWVLLVSFTPHVIVVYALVLLLLVVAAIAGRGRARRVNGWLAVLVAPLLALHLFWISELYVGEEAVAEGSRLSVMSANLSFGDADPDRVVGLAAEHQADIVVLLEITAQARAALRRAGLDRAYPHAEGEPADEVSGTMVFSRYPLGDVTTLDTKFRGYTMQVGTPDGRLSLVAVHPPPPLQDAAQWRADHDTLRRAAVAADGPTVIAGDLNATLDHRPMRELEGQGFADAAAQANSGWQPTWPDADRVAVFGIRVPTLLQIDHVLTDHDFGVLATETPAVPGTDHRAVVATLMRR